MKILLLGDYSNCHSSLAKGLRQLGHEVTLISNGSGWMNCNRDIDISRKANKISGLKLFYKLTLGRTSKLLKGYDVVALIDINFVRLKPQRLKIIFDQLRRNNKSVFLTAASTDIAYLDMLQASDSPLRYSEWFVNGKPSRMYLNDPKQWIDWHNPKLVKYQQYVFERINGAVSVLYEYHLGMLHRLGAERVAYGGIPIDMSRFSPVEIPEKLDRVKIFLGRDRNRQLMKGSDLLEQAARLVVDRHPEHAALEIVENVPYDEFIEKLRNSHIVLDQIYSYTPATTALMAMAYGIPVVSGAEPEFYDFINERDNCPIINAGLTLEELTETIEQLVLNRHTLSEIGRRSRQFVATHNDSAVVAQRYVDFWSSHINSTNTPSKNDS